MNLHVSLTSFQLQMPCCMGGRRARGEQTLPLSRRTRNGRGEAVEKQEARPLHPGKDRGGGLKHGPRGGKEAWSSCGLVLCGRLVILLFWCTMTTSHSFLTAWTPIDLHPSWASKRGVGVQGGATSTRGLRWPVRWDEGRGGGRTGACTL